MLQQFKTHIDTNLPFLKESELLIAVSGGMDSVVLTHLCHQLKLNVSLAHCNFNLRGEESDDDEVFVNKLAETLNLEVFTQKFDTENYARNEKLSIQMAARELRYHWFDELAQQLNFDYILTAHHADDNLETFLINLSRGTGLEGLTGIPEINDNIVRPLLPFSRDDIKNHINSNALNFRDDSSNTSVKYLRNKLRHEVIPILKEINPQLLQNFSKTQSYLKASQDIIEDRVDDVSNTIIDRITDQGVYYNIKHIKNLINPKAYLYALLSDYGFTEWNDIYNLLEAQSGKYVQSNSHRLIKDRSTLILTELKEGNIHEVIISGTDKSIETPIGTLMIEAVNDYKEEHKHTIYVDADKLQFPLILRQWQEGDYFYPLGMRGKKKLSKYFKDEKFSLVDKENTWVICSNNNIIWILGMRMDERFKITDSTRNILELELISTK